MRWDGRGRRGGKEEENRYRISGERDGCTVGSESEGGSEERGRTRGTVQVRPATTQTQRRAGHNRGVREGLRGRVQGRAQPEDGGGAHGHTHHTKPSADPTLLNK